MSYLVIFFKEQDDLVVVFKVLKWASSGNVLISFLKPKGLKSRQPLKYIKKSYCLSSLLYSLISFLSGACKLPW